MGTDIHGWVEVRKHEYYWSAITKIDDFVGRDYDMFGMLFGVYVSSYIQPIAETRGLPEKLSYIARWDHKSWDLDAHSESWVTWKEITEIDWLEEATEWGSAYLYSPDDFGIYRPVPKSPKSNETDIYISMKM